jgi:hypothetical protein
VAWFRPPPSRIFSPFRLSLRLQHGFAPRCGWNAQASLECPVECGLGLIAGLRGDARQRRIAVAQPGHWIEIFRGYYGPVVKAFAAIDPPAREALEADLYALLDKFNVAEDGTLVIPSEYLEVVISKKS